MNTNTLHHTTVRYLLIIVILNQSQDNNWEEERTPQVKETSFHPSVHSSGLLSLHPVRQYRGYMEQDKSTFLSILVHYYNLKRHWICGAERTAISPSLMHTHTHHSCWFISGAELNTPDWRHVQPQLQIDRLSSPVASASYSPSAQHVFIHSYCSYERISQTYCVEITECFIVSILWILCPLFPASFLLLPLLKTWP